MNQGVRRDKTKPSRFSVFLLPLLLFLCLGLAPSLTLAAPVIFYTDIVSGPNTGGENNNGVYLSIFGKGFGASQGTSTVTINGVQVAAYKQWGAPSMVFSSHGIQVITVQPGSAVSSGPIVVTVNGTPSNSDHTFTVQSGNIYFASLTGNDSTAAIGNITKPWGNPQTVINRSDFNNGAVLVMRGGTWTANTQYFLYIRQNNSGLNHVTIMGYPGEAVVTTRGFSTYAGGGINNYLTIADISCQNSGGYDCFPLNDSTNSRIINNEVTGLSGTGGGIGTIQSYASNNTISGNYAHDNGITMLYHAIYISDDSGSHPTNIEIAWNHIMNQTGGRGIQIYNGNSGIAFSNFRIHDNVVHDVALDGILLGDQSGTGMTVYNNIVYRTGVPAFQTNGTAGGCLRLNSSYLVVAVYNNTFYDCGVDLNGSSGAMRLDAVNAVTFHDNIFNEINSEQYLAQTIANSTISSSNNLWFGAGSPPTWDSSAVNADPKFIDPTSPARNFHLQTGNPAIDSGVTTSAVRDFDGVVRPQGSTFDIGAFEFCTSGCTAGNIVPPAPPTGLTVK